MEKVAIKDFRKTVDIKLPISGVTLTCYSSILIGDLPTSTPKEVDLNENLSIVIKLIKGWNLYEKNEDENPLDITLDNLKKLPAPDFQFLVNELKVFSSEQKKT